MMHSCCSLGTICYDRGLVYLQDTRVVSYKVEENLLIDYKTHLGAKKTFIKS